MENFVPPAQRLFEDEFVLDFLPPLGRFLLRRAAARAAYAALFDAAAPGIRGALLCRTRRIDDAVCEAVGGGSRTLVILGAGLDTRPYRLTGLADLTILEVDLPQVQEFKKACLLRRFGVLPPQVRFVAIDFNTERLDGALARGGLSPSERAIFVWEGVSQYLQSGAVDSVLRSIAGRPEGTELVFTYVLEEVITGAYRPGRSTAFRRGAKWRPEPWHFGIDPAQVATFLAERGLTLRRDFGAEEHQADYLRPVGRKLEVSGIERVALAKVQPLP
jgi:methyltransferase (TIGR00027 family)